MIRHVLTVITVQIVWLMWPSIASAQHLEQQQIDDTIERYEEAFPDIEFILLRDIDELNLLIPFESSLGPESSNVDYEHPTEARVTLLEAQQYRISLQIEHHNGSATLFRTPKSPLTEKPYICLITLTESLLSDDPLAATKFMFDVEEEVIDKLPKSLHFDNSTFFLYTVDHEVFHCIDAYASGFLFPRTKDELKACRDRSRTELRAEVFSAMSHLSRQPGDVAFLNKLAIARTINLLSGDVEHYTRDALLAIVNDDSQFTKHTLSDRAYASMKFAERITQGYREHRAFMASVLQALTDIGVNSDFLLIDYPELAVDTPRSEDVESIKRAIGEAVSALQ